MTAMNDSGARQKRPACLVDGSLYVFRAWHSTPDDFVDREGQPVNAVHGYTRFLCALIEQQRPTHLMVAFDAALTRSFRNTIYPPYKANRELPPPNLQRQFELCHAITEAMGVTVLSNNSYEADDLIGSMLWTLRAEHIASVIVSADKDFGQLLGEHDEQWDFARNRRWGPAGVMEKLGVRPHQVADYLALAGDTVDNIPGVPGIGAKTAATLLNHFDNLESLLQRLDEVPYLRFRGAASCATRLRENADNARLFARITRIALDAPVPERSDDLHRKPVNHVRLQALCEQLRFGPLTRARLKSSDGERA